MNGSDFFGRDLPFGADANDGGYGASSCLTSHHASPAGTQNAASITPESFHSYQNGRQQQDTQDSRLRGSPFDFSDYDESINFGISSAPRPIDQSSQGRQAGAQQGDLQQFEEGSNAVKSEFSPVFAASESSSTSQASSWAAKPGTNDFFNDGYDYLVKDELNVNLDDDGSFGTHETNGKVFKKRKEKTSHNVIEKKYRTNINDKIFQLREIVPTLRVAYKKYSGIPVVAQDAADLDGLEPARKLNKASILLKTIEYIQHLEVKCSRYKSENQRLKSNISTPESLRAPRSVAPIGTIPDSQEASTHSNNIPTELPNQFDRFPLNSAYEPLPLSVPQSAYDDDDDQSRGSNNASTDYTSKLLMGGLAMTMGASCFSDSGEMGSARALFAMPIFHFSPHSGYALSNANGMVDFQASLFALLKISLVVITALYLVNSLLFSSKKSSDKSAGSDVGTIIPTKDTVRFDSVENLKQTLLKTFILNKLKYKFNSMERIESRVAKCFAIKLYFKNSGFPWNKLANMYISKRWNELKEQVKVANLKTKGSLIMGLEWSMITNVASVGDELTLDNYRLLAHLSMHHQEYELKDFLSTVNSFVLKEKVEEILGLLLQKSVDGEYKDLAQLTQSFHQNFVLNDKILESMPEDLTVIDCLTDPHKASCDKLSKLIKVSSGLKSDVLLEEQLVLYSSVMRNLINLHKFDQCAEWMNRMPLREVSGSKTRLSIVGFTAMYLMLNAIFDNLQEFKQYPLSLERICGDLRVWLGSSLGEVIELGTRNKLINYCIDKALLCDSLTICEGEEYDKAESDTEDDREDKEEYDDDMTDFEADEESKR